MHRHRVIAIVGPTASGKSDVAEAVARAVGGEIVSADSMQIYRRMDIGTAKVPEGERGAQYHCIDLVDPGTTYSAACFQRDAREAIAGILDRGHVAIVCGGTGLYVRAALDDMRFPAGEQVGNETRDHYARLADELGAEALHALLVERDPESAELIHPNNVRRVIRAFELLEEGQTTYAKQHEGLAHLPEHILAKWYGITMDRQALYDRIDARVDWMVAHGLREEIQGLLADGFRDALTAPQAIGYKELIEAIEAGEGPHDAGFIEGVEQIKQASRRYAKRQLTWFGKDGRIEWHTRDPHDEGFVVRLAQHICADIDS